MAAPLVWTSRLLRLVLLAGAAVGITLLVLPLLVPLAHHMAVPA
jgi:hypothetical protein